VQLRADAEPELQRRRITGLPNRSLGAVGVLPQPVANTPQTKRPIEKYLLAIGALSGSTFHVGTGDLPRLCTGCRNAPPNGVSDRNADDNAV
jgi:hypothetical protein